MEEERNTKEEKPSNDEKAKGPKRRNATQEHRSVWCLALVRGPSNGYGHLLPRGKISIRGAKRRAKMTLRAVSSMPLLDSSYSINAITVFL